MSAGPLPVEQQLNPLSDIDFADLEKSLLRPRTLMSGLLSALVAAMTILALIPLFSVVWMLVWRGGHKLSALCFTQLPPAPLEQGGGFGNAIVGTLIIVVLATLISVPVGVLSAVFLEGSDPRNKLAQAVRFAAKVLTGFPSILAGVFAYGAIVLATGGYSAIAGAIAVSILMLPTILLTAEDAIRMVPAKMKEAAIGMGATSTQVTWMVLTANSDARDSHRRHAGHRARRGRNGAAAVHRAVQQLLADASRPPQSDAANGVVGRPDLQFCRACPSRTRWNWLGPPRWCWCCWCW